MGPPRRVSGVDPFPVTGSLPSGPPRSAPGRSGAGALRFDPHAHDGTPGDHDDADDLDAAADPFPQSGSPQPRGQIRRAGRAGWRLSRVFPGFLAASHAPFPALRPGSARHPRSTGGGLVKRTGRTAVNAAGGVLATGTGVTAGSTTGAAGYLAAAAGIAATKGLAATSRLATATGVAATATARTGIATAVGGAAGGSPFPAGAAVPGSTRPNPASDTMMIDAARLDRRSRWPECLEEPDPEMDEMEQERSSRAGRNLSAAVAVGLGLGVAVLASLWFRKEVFVALTSAAIVLGVWELAAAFTARRITIPVIPLAVGAVGILVSAFVAGEEGLLVAFSLTAFGSLLWRIIDGLQDAARDVAAAVFTAAYVPFLAGFAMLMLAESDGALRIIVFILVVVANDIGGYATGVLFGRHPMAPVVSPKKSWEGFGGSLLTGMIAGALGVTVLLHGPWWAGVVVGAAAVVTATLGDLSESLLKRDLGIKDMGHLLPGHGGVMDRLDSLLPTAPAVYLLLSLLVASR